MLITIHNLPLSATVQHIKALIQLQCGLTDIVVDNPETEGSTKKVKVGVGDDADGAIVFRKLDGILYQGRQLKVKDPREKRNLPKPSNMGQIMMSSTSIQQQLQTMQAQVTMFQDNPMSSVTNTAIYNYAPQMCPPPLSMGSQPQMGFPMIGMQEQMGFPMTGMQEQMGFPIMGMQDQMGLPMLGMQNQMGMPVQNLQQSVPQTQQMGFQMVDMISENLPPPETHSVSSARNDANNIQIETLDWDIPTRRSVSPDDEYNHPVWGVRPRKPNERKTIKQPTSQPGRENVKSAQETQFRQQQNVVPNLIQQQNFVPNLKQQQNFVPNLKQQQNIVPNLKQKRPNLKQLEIYQRNFPQQNVKQNFATNTFSKNSNFDRRPYSNNLERPHEQNSYQHSNSNQQNCNDIIYDQNEFAIEGPSTSTKTFETPIPQNNYNEFDIDGPRKDLNRQSQNLKQQKNFVLNLKQQLNVVPSLKQQQNFVPNLKQQQNIVPNPKQQRPNLKQPEIYQRNFPQQNVKQNFSTNTFSKNSNFDRRPYSNNLERPHEQNSYQHSNSNQQKRNDIIYDQNEFAIEGPSTSTKTFETPILQNKYNEFDIDGHKKDLKRPIQKTEHSPASNFKKTKFNKPPKMYECIPDLTVSQPVENVKTQEQPSFYMTDNDSDSEEDSDLEFGEDTNNNPEEDIESNPVDIGLRSIVDSDINFTNESTMVPEKIFKVFKRWQKDNLVYASSILNDNERNTYKKTMRAVCTRILEMVLNKQCNVIIPSFQIFKMFVQLKIQKKMSKRQRYSKNYFYFICNTFDELKLVLLFFLKWYEDKCGEHLNPESALVKAYNYLVESNKPPVLFKDHLKFSKKPGEGLKVKKPDVEFQKIQSEMELVQKNEVNSIINRVQSLVEFRHESLHSDFHRFNKNFAHMLSSRMRALFISKCVRISFCEGSNKLSLIKKHVTEYLKKHNATVVHRAGRSLFVYCRTWSAMPTLCNMKDVVIGGIPVQSIIPLDLIGSMQRNIGVINKFLCFRYLKIPHTFIEPKLFFDDDDDDLVWSIKTNVGRPSSSSGGLTAETDIDTKSYKISQENNVTSHFVNDNKNIDVDLKIKSESTSVNDILTSITDTLTSITDSRASTNDTKTSMNDTRTCIIKNETVVNETKLNVKGTCIIKNETVVNETELNVNAAELKTTKNDVLDEASALGLPKDVVENTHSCGIVIKSESIDNGVSSNDKEQDLKLNKIDFSKPNEGEYKEEEISSEPNEQKKEELEMSAANDNLETDESNEADVSSDIDEKVERLLQDIDNDDEIFMCDEDLEDFIL